MGIFTERYYALTEDALRPIRTWAEKNGLKIKYQRLESPKDYNGRKYCHELTIGIELGNTEQFSALDILTENVFKFDENAGGSFQVMEEQEDVCTKKAKAVA